MTLDSAQALAWSEQIVSMSALYPSSTHTGSDAIVTDRLLASPRPHFRVRTSTLSILVNNLVDGTGSMNDYVWRLNQGATALDAVVFYDREDGAPAMLCVQIKFSSQDSTTRLSWADSCEVRLGDGGRVRRSGRSEMEQCSWACRVPDCCTPSARDLLRNRQEEAPPSHYGEGHRLMLGGLAHVPRIVPSRLT